MLRLPVPVEKEPSHLHKHELANTEGLITLTYLPTDVLQDFSASLPQDLKAEPPFVQRTEINYSLPLEQS